MQLLLDNSPLVRDLLAEFGFLPSPRQFADENSMYILLRGMRWKFINEWPDKDQCWEDCTEDTESELRDKLEDLMDSCRDFQDFLMDNIELTISLQPKNIGRELLAVKVNVSDKEMIKLTSEIVTNSLGQRKLNGRG